MPKNLSRHYGRGDLQFITFSCYHRAPLLDTSWRRDFFLKTLGTVRDQYSFLLVGYVVMPEHVHLLIGEPPEGTPSTVLMVLKHLVAARLKNRHPKVQHFWQRRFYDFNVHSTKKIREKLNYMHQNPVNRGLVKLASDWPWSSFLNYEMGEPGLLPIDFVAQ